MSSGIGPLGPSNVDPTNNEAEKHPKGNPPPFPPQVTPSANTTAPTANTTSTSSSTSPYNMQNLKTLIEASVVRQSNTQSQEATQQEIKNMQQIQSENAGDS